MGTLNVACHSMPWMQLRNGVLSARLAADGNRMIGTTSHDALHLGVSPQETASWTPGARRDFWVPAVGMDWEKLCPRSHRLRQGETWLWGTESQTWEWSYHRPVREWCLHWWVFFLSIFEINVIQDTHTQGCFLFLDRPYSFCHWSAFTLHLCTQREKQGSRCKRSSRVEYLRGPGAITLAQLFI